MSQILDRIGAFTFMQVSIEVWNEIFLLILISVMMIGIRHDRTDELQKKIKIPLTHELILFYAAILISSYCVQPAFILTLRITVRE